MDDGKQARFGSEGELQTDDRDETDDESESVRDDFGNELEENETKSGVNRYVVTSLLQKAVRRSDEETAAWAAWELVRSGYAWNFWDRITLFLVEDLRAGHEVALVVRRYEELARERWSEDSWRGRLCAVHAALAAARAPSSRESVHAEEYFDALSDERVRAREENREPRYEHPADGLEPGGTYDAVFDHHTADGKRLGRDVDFFRAHGARVGPDGEPELSRQWRLRSMRLEDREYTEDELARAVRPVDPDDRWSESEPDRCSEE
ncbi:hypothetical protein [Natrialbaceae archaeon AArc-T1-2]|uniref:hypothetical protein n=1 Tax=Natrialbaceae archaeon AArc-T1-2 TaxID=3053904 RepID=UPI00255ABF9C|nr:hypothetical protein [Natrialbaceae archaeon AArc-T1-2]WIV65926.1 hypothetical protein QQ977_09470 [Natrialbaceae archaeon AArc-T1-2]